ncbi:MAG: hypothetical protein WCJ70_02545 [bacterium]
MSKTCPPNNDAVGEGCNTKFQFISSLLPLLSVIPVLVNLFDDGFYQVILNEVKNLTILAHEILLPPERAQAPTVVTTPGLRPEEG